MQETAVVTCDNCTLSSTLRTTYKRVRRPKQTLCPRCWYRHALIQAGRYRVTAVLWASVAVAFMFAFKTGPWLLANFVIVMGLLLVPSVIVHELAHAATATLLEFEVPRIRIGIGPVRFERRLFGYVWQVRRYLAGGAVHVVPVAFHDLKRRFLLLTAAGPVANFLVAAGAYAVLATGYSEDPFLAPAPLTVLMYTNGALAIGNLLPFTSAMGQQTDGKALLLGLRGGAEWLTTLEIALHVARFVELRRAELTEAALQATADAARAHPHSAILLCNLGVAYLDAQRYAESRTTFERALALAKEPVEQAIVRNNLAYLFMESGALDDLPSGAEHSAVAYAAMPWHPAVGATHALYELRADRAANAVAILEAALGDELQPSSRKGTLYILALAKLRLGERGAAVTLAAEAEALAGDTRWQSAFARSLSSEGQEPFEALVARA